MLVAKFNGYEKSVNSQLNCECDVSLVLVLWRSQMANNGPSFTSCFIRYLCGVLSRKEYSQEGSKHRRTLEKITGDLGNINLAMLKPIASGCVKTVQTLQENHSEKYHGYHLVYLQNFGVNINSYRLI